MTWNLFAITTVVNLKSTTVYLRPEVLSRSQGRTPSLQRPIKFSSVLVSFSKIPVLLWSRNTWGSALLSAHSVFFKELQDRAKVLALRSQLWAIEPCQLYTRSDHISLSRSNYTNTSSGNFHTHIWCKTSHAFQWEFSAIYRKPPATNLCKLGLWFSLF